MGIFSNREGGDLPWYADRLVVLRPEASDSDLAKLNVIRTPEERNMLTEVVGSVVCTFGKLPEYDADSATSLEGEEDQ